MGKKTKVENPYEGMSKEEMEHEQEQSHLKSLLEGGKITKEEYERYSKKMNLSRVKPPKGCTNECIDGKRVPKCTATVEDRKQYCGQVPEEYIKH